MRGITRNSCDYERAAKGLRRRRLEIIITWIEDCSSERQTYRWEEGRTVLGEKGEINGM